MLRCIKVGAFIYDLFRVIKINIWDKVMEKDGQISLVRDG